MYHKAFPAHAHQEKAIANTQDEQRDSLPPGTVIDCYSIIKLIGSGGFSLIYLAEDEDSLDHVVIKEYLPKKLAVRTGGRKIRIKDGEKSDSFHNARKLFYQEVEALAMLRHANIVNVRTFFLANDTAYLVMDYEYGKNLGSYIKQRGGRMSTTFLLTVFPPVLDALQLIHDKDYLHLDIKPSNIHLRPGGDPLLLDFGAVHRFTDAGNGQSSQVITPGFAPIEQYYAAGTIGPWSDVYAMGATMRACLEGKPPPSSVERHAKDRMQPVSKLFKGRYPPYLLEIIDWAMEMEPGSRPQNAGCMLEALNGKHGRPDATNQREHLASGDNS